MGRKLYINTPDAKKVLRKLAKNFYISVPKLDRHRPKATYSLYYEATNTIILTYNSDLDVLLHEFAHALSYIKGGVNHDETFWLCLLEVILYYYGGDYHKYGWKYEYKAGQRFYKEIKEIDNDVRDQNWYS